MPLSEWKEVFYLKKAILKLFDDFGALLFGAVINRQV
jgi:hypothetical protein